MCQAACVQADLGVGARRAKSVFPPAEGGAVKFVLSGQS